ncbi:MAG: leucine-rich repeat domain-containing protein, partial [Candidatus Limisoma sp.]
MKKYLHLLIALLAFPALAAAQEGTVTLTTNLEAGTEITLRVWTSSVNDPLTIDWGDGNAKSYTIDPNGWSWTLNTKGNVLGPTITITGSLVNLECTSAGITACTIENQPTLNYINLSKNALTEFSLPSLPALETLNLSENQIDSHAFDISAVGSSLKELNVSKNGNNFITLNLMGFTALESFYGYNNPEMTTVVFADNADNLKRIDMHECHIMHFYSRSMPALSSLNLSDNALLDFEDGNYPELTYFYIANNYLTELDITKYPKLYQFTCAGNDITSINPSNCPELISFNVSDNKIKNLDLSNNKAITSLYVQD